MIILFNDFYDAVNYVIQFNMENNNLISVCAGGSSIWINNDQEILFPVVKFKRITTISVINIFLANLNMSCNCVELISSELDNIFDVTKNLEIILISEWTMIVKIESQNKLFLKGITEKINNLNAKLAEYMSEIHGFMTPIKCQPTKYHKIHSLYSIGVR